MRTPAPPSRKRRRGTAAVEHLAKVALLTVVGATGFATIGGSSATLLVEGEPNVDDGERGFDGEPDGLGTTAAASTDSGEAHSGEAHSGEAHSGEAHSGEAHSGEAHSGDIGHFVVGLQTGDPRAYGAVRDFAQMLIEDPGAALDLVVATGRALVEEWSHRWSVCVAGDRDVRACSESLGELAPDVALILATGGTGAVATRGSAALAALRAGEPRAVVTRILGRNVRGNVDDLVESAGTRADDLADRGVPHRPDESPAGGSSGALDEVETVPGEAAPARELDRGASPDVGRVYDDVALATWREGLEPGTLAALDRYGLGPSRPLDCEYAYSRFLR
jgi:hypothetical protein